MNEFWNTRYSSPIYAYGTQPNAFFSECLQPLKPGRMLLPAEGEGRNAVYAAQQGWAVDAFDFSEAARDKALQLAGGACVSIRYNISTLQDFTVPENTYDLIGLVYVHMPPAERSAFHQRLISWLKPSGRIVLEAFHKEQLGRNSGGPQNSDMLYSRTELLQDFKGLDILQLEEVYTDLDEGPFHHGTACVLRMVATLPV
ncbi:class I SAM-dependent methyltransferase [Fibrella aquatica]|jgi:SAM-dependent methyltransferase|uniref:class I SAM-dependent methyltransferase n=1 Tax=Fibrella aquatica TaxID=3242487 RepID=UPI00351FC153